LSAFLGADLMAPRALEAWPPIVDEFVLRFVRKG
jgi:hypothetical protein